MPQVRLPRSSAQGNLWQERKEYEAQFQCRHLQEGRIQQSSMVGQQRQHVSELQFDKFPNPQSQSFLVWKIQFRNQVTTCSDFSSEAMLWVKEVEMVHSMEELKSSRSVAG